MKKIIFLLLFSILFFPKTTLALEPQNDYDTVTGSFDIASEILDAGIEGGYDIADKVSAILTLDGTLDETVTDYTKIGTITVKIV